jgi:hypothetical protein
MPRKVLIQIRRGTEAELAGVTLSPGELGFTTDTKKLYIGTASGNVVVGSVTSVGDMLKSVYDTDNDGVVDAAETANSVPWTGVTGKPSTFTPAAHTHPGTDITSRVSSASAADSVPWSGVTEKPSTFPPSSHTHDDRYFTESESDSRYAKRAGYSTTVSAAGWYRIAINGPVSTGGNGGSRAHALFTVRDTQSGLHSAVTFYASYHYGANPTLVVLSRSWYGSQGIVKKIRLISGATYEGAAVEVYCGAAGPVSFTIYDNEHSTGWTPENWTAGSIPTGFTATQIDLDTYDPILAIAANGRSNLFYVQRNGSGTFMPKGPVTWNQLAGT